MTLLDLWRKRADDVEPYSPPAATAIRTCADELERQQQMDQTELVSPTEAALLSGYDADSIGRMIRDGRLTNHGSKNRPKVRRSDLPKKATVRELDLASIANTPKKRRA